jgi:predicted MFS family arabinose efflux permease
MSVYSGAVFLGVLYAIPVLLLFVGIGMIIGSHFLKRYLKESRTLARHGLLSFMFGVFGILWPPCSVLLLIMLVLLGVVNSSTRSK